ncbi:PREDICTED: endocuticle structural glycoprotein SgAbd-2-like [Dinoponera quadriceps]|uniref:Endocuticle structural glycoprotein SgAbd-2-like n=1 Tax=Dinoponera quadriceps TaxID=609295 RepID=A0A6P3XZQ2_DINQU|nr:PREDICTED: endocuticle structural glycoprotein SgAbd-2-like [Dinoponera quadriceps]
MVHRGIIYSLIWLLWFPACFPARRLLPVQQAPLFVRGSRDLVPVLPFMNRPRAASNTAFSMNVVDEDKQELFNDFGYQVIGHYAYTSPEGIPVYVSYIADDKGYRAKFNLGSVTIPHTPVSHVGPVSYAAPIPDAFRIR